MAKEKRLRIKTLVMVLAMVVCANAGDLLLKRGMTEIGAVAITVSGVSHAFWMTVTNPTIWAGIVFLTGFMVSYMTVLSWADDSSYVMPAERLIRDIDVAGGAVFARERDFEKMGGRAADLSGVLLVGQTKPRTDGKRRDAEGTA
jgi:hypothetical protein